MGKESHFSISLQSSRSLDSELTVMRRYAFCAYDKNKYDSMNQHNPHVLVVDGDPIVRESVQGVLRNAGFWVLVAEDGETALQKFDDNTIDAIFTDINLEGINGFDLMQQVQETDENVRVVIMTSDDSYDMVLRALQEGAYDYLEKPLSNHDAIVSSARRATENARLQRENTLLVQHLQANHAKLEIANERLLLLNSKLKHLANTDGLTDLYNRRYIDGIIEQEAERRNRYEDPLSVILFDVDNFKRFNDEYGHDGGDRALIQVTKVVRDCARSTDIVGRYGGEEFIVVLTKTGPENAMIFAERLRIAIAETSLDLDGSQAQLNISLGVAGVNSNDSEISGRDLILRADKALYHAKENGRNRSCGFDSSIDDPKMSDCLSCVDNEVPDDDDLDEIKIAV